MSTKETRLIKIPAPEFGQYETVLKDFNGIELVQIVARWFELDKDSWWYKCAGEDHTNYPESAFSHVPPNFNLEEFKKHY